MDRNGGLVADQLEIGLKTLLLLPADMAVGGHDAAADRHGQAAHRKQQIPDRDALLEGLHDPGGAADCEDGADYRADSGQQSAVLRHAGFCLFRVRLLHLTGRLGIPQICGYVGNCLFNVERSPDVGQNVQPVCDEQAGAKRRERRAEQNKGDDVPALLASLLSFLQVVKVHGEPPCFNTPILSQKCPHVKQMFRNRAKILYCGIFLNSYRILTGFLLRIPFSKIPCTFPGDCVSSCSERVLSGSLEDPCPNLCEKEKREP